jgi:hypothetical protein
MPLSDLVVKGRPRRLREEPAGACEGGCPQVVAEESAVEAPDAGCVRS